MTNTRNRFIDVLKGICVIFIIITHFSWSSQERLALFFPYWIDMAVPIFMIVSGYVYTLSYKKNQIEKVEDAFLLKNIINKIIRYTIPFAMAFMIEEIVFVIKGIVPLSVGSIASLIVTFIDGNLGPGGYYYPLMMQFIFVFPIIHMFVKKYEYGGVVICGVINMIYEVLQRAYMMNEECYRLLLFRYTLLIATGVYLAYGYDTRCARGKKLASFVIGSLFIFAYNYMEYKPYVIRYWTGTSFIAALYIIPIICILVKSCEIVHFFPLEVIGKASYNIFLTQMVWYGIYYSTGAPSISAIIENSFFQIIFNVSFCLLIGVVFYIIEQPITKWIINRIYNGKCKALNRDF